MPCLAARASVNAVFRDRHAANLSSLGVTYILSSLNTLVFGGMKYKKDKSIGLQVIFVIGKIYIASKPVLTSQIEIVSTLLPLGGTYSVSPTP